MSESGWPLLGADTDSAFTSERSNYVVDGGLLLPVQASATFHAAHEPGLTVAVQAVRQSRSVGAIARHVSVWCVSRPLTQADLRGIPVADLAARTITANALRPSPPPSRPDEPPHQVDGRGKGWWWWPSPDVNATRVLRRKRTPRTARDLAAVARVYSEAVERGDNPTQAVQRAFELGTSRTAVRWVNDARDAGHPMPPAPRRPRATEGDGQ